MYNGKGSSTNLMKKNMHYAAITLAHETNERTSTQVRPGKLIV